MVQLSRCTCALQLFHALQQIRRADSRDVIDGLSHLTVHHGIDVLVAVSRGQLRYC